ncbi:helix-turn-helix transcriptional regulator [Arundinibacter roseus]|uniref:XRE family transcriptional regulator n=1 Tax=Arundinibacter roseus TaxID=2070510 RepID=A0A4R4KKW7_9BACT|nr:helix-turn-helix transcriptional regulator [Arundinibacter roseus]TDB68944.1 XRE family transcriptional regulator [Arundinibacter roseus]
MDTEMTSNLAAERLADLRVAMNLSRPKFAILVELGAHTISRVENEMTEPSEYMLSQIEKAIPGSTAYILGKTHFMPSHPLLEKTKDEHEGQSLRVYLKRKDIKQADLSKKIGVTRAMINVYLNTSRFRSDVKEKILHALNVPEEIVFGEKNLNLLTTRLSSVNQPVYKEFVVLPKLDPQIRTDLTLQKIVDTLLHFDDRNPQPDGWLMRRGRLTDEELASAVVFETIPSDYVKFKPGTLLVGYLLSADQFEDLKPDDLVAVRVAEQLLIAPVYKNTMEKPEGELMLLLEFNSLILKVPDIEYMFYISHVIESDLSR